MREESKKALLKKKIRRVERREFSQNLCRVGIEVGKFPKCKMYRVLK